jgi:hypothetical protein
MENEIAAPFGLAMTTCGVKILNAFVLRKKTTTGAKNNIKSMRGKIDQKGESHEPFQDHKKIGFEENSDRTAHLFCCLHDRRFLCPASNLKIIIDPKTL